MAAPKLYGQRVSTAVRLSVAVHERLAAFAETQRVPRNMIIERALIEFLERQERVGQHAPFDWSRSTTSPESRA